MERNNLIGDGKLRQKSFPEIDGTRRSCLAHDRSQTQSASLQIGPIRKSRQDQQRCGECPISHHLQSPPQKFRLHLHHLRKWPSLQESAAPTARPSDRPAGQNTRSGQFHPHVSCRLEFFHTLPCRQVHRPMPKQKRIREMEERYGDAFYSLEIRNGFGDSSCCRHCLRPK